MENGATTMYESWCDAAAAAVPMSSRPNARVLQSSRSMVIFVPISVLVCRYTDRYASIGTRFHDMFVGPFIWFFRGLAGLKMKPGTAGWKQLQIAPVAYNFWSVLAGSGSFLPGVVEVTTATWGANCRNRSSWQDMSVAMQAACSGQSQCTFPYVLRRLRINRVWSLRPEPCLG